jgi:hypothetical protein
MIHSLFERDALAFEPRAEVGERSSGTLISQTSKRTRILAADQTRRIGSADHRQSLVTESFSCFH